MKIKKEIIFLKRCMELGIPKEQLIKFKTLLNGNIDFFRNLFNFDDENKLFNKKIENEKKSFKKYIFDPNKVLENLEYSSNEKKIGINDFICDLSLIKELINSNKEIIYQVNRPLTKNKNSSEIKSYMRTFYVDINNQEEGLDTFEYTKLLFETITENIIENPKCYLEEREVYLYTIKELIKILKLHEKNIIHDKVLENYLNLHEKILLFHNTTPSLTELEKSKYYGILAIEYLLLLDCTLVKKLISEEENMINQLKSFADSKKKKSINVSQKAKENYYKDEFERKFNGEYDKNKINYYFNELNKISKSEKKMSNKEKEIINYLEKFLLVEFDNLKTIKDQLTYSYISWLNINDLLAEVKLYLNLLDTDNINTKKKAINKDRKNLRDDYIKNFEIKKIYIHEKIKLIKKFLGEENINIYKESLLSYQRILLSTRDYNPSLTSRYDINILIFNLTYFLLKNK